MNKKIIISMIVLLMIGLVVAGGLLKTDKPLKIEKSKLDMFKEKLNINSKDDIKISVSSISCDDNSCWASVSYPNLINTEWRTQKNYCSAFNESFDDCDCLEYFDYTDNELEIMRDDFVKKRLEDYADALTERNKIKTEKVGGGVLTLK